MSNTTAPSGPGNLWRREPVLVIALVEALVALVTAFGLELSGEQVAGIMATVAAILGLVVRQRVSPSSS